MRLRVIGSDTTIKANNISDAAKAILALQNQGTAQDSTGAFYFNDIDNKSFQYFCNMYKNRVFLDESNFLDLLNTWFWTANFENGDFKNFRFESATDYMDEKSEDIILLKALAPYIEDGSYILFSKEDYSGSILDNFVKFEFYLGRVHVQNCTQISFMDCDPSNQYDCFNQIKTLINGAASTSSTQTNNQGYFTYNFTGFTPTGFTPTSYPSTSSSQPSSPTQKTTPKYGGICKRCGLYDDYAEQDAQGKVLCYKCNGGLSGSIS